MKPRKHAELIKQWADGADIEVKNSGKWEDTCNPRWHESRQYRVKPNTLKFRVYMNTAGGLHVALYDQEKSLAHCERSYFSQWLTDWIEVVI